MANQANIKAVITAEDRASATLKGFGNNVDGLSTRLKVGLLAAGGAAIKFGYDSIKAFSESQDLIAQTNAVLKSTGQVAGVTADQVSKLATAWEHQTKFSDEAVRNVENVLLTFTNINKNVFPQTTQAVLDISTALHEDLQTAAIQVGKAMQDPVLGVTALRRVGVNFSQAQQDVIKKLVDTNQTAKAQAMILQELQKEFGGSAKAAGDTFSGAVAKLKNRFDDFQESVGQFIVNAIPVLLSGMRQIGDFLDKAFGPSFQALANTFTKSLIPAFKRLYDAMQPALMDVLKVLGIVIGVTLVVAINVLANALNVVIKIFSSFVSATSVVIKGLGNLGSSATKIAGGIKNVFKDAFNAIARAWNDTIGKINFKFPSWVPKLGGKGFDVPDIPYLAEGGIVTQPTLAMIGEAGPEAVVPLKKAGGLGNIHITIQAGMLMSTDIEARKMAQTLFKHLSDLASSKNMTIGQLLT